MPEEPVAEQLVRVITALVSEVAVLRERLDTLEKLVEQKGILAANEIEDYAPDEGLEVERQQWRQKYLERIFAGLRAEVDEALAKTTSQE